jgi:subtilisin family serine protease
VVGVKTTGVALVMAFVLLSQMTVAAGEPAAGDQVETFELGGHIETARSDLTSLTTITWRGCSPDVEPLMQGYDAWLFVVPWAAVTTGFELSATGRSAAPYDLHTVLYDENCVAKGVVNDRDNPGDAHGTAPRGTRYVMVQLSEGADVDVTLRGRYVVTAPPPSSCTSPTPPPDCPAYERRAYPAQPDDPAAADQWALRRVSAPSAWAHPQSTGYGIQVAVIDSGIDLSHPDLQCPGKVRLFPGSDVVGGDDIPEDQDGHGTAVASIVGACTANATDMAGVAPDAVLAPYRVFTRTTGTIDDVLTAVRRAVDDGAHVVNLSLSTEVAGPLSPVNSFVDAADYAHSRGAVLVAASGNDLALPPGGNGSLPLCGDPASVGKVLCVGATGRDDNVADYSRGTVKLSEHQNGMVAPGTEVLRLKLGGGTETDGWGTSFAAPHVAGAAALVYDRLGGERSTANADAVIRALTSTADDLGLPGFDPQYGWGMLDVAEAVASVTPPARPSEPASR